MVDSQLEMGDATLTLSKFGVHSPSKGREEGDSGKVLNKSFHPAPLFNQGVQTCKENLAPKASDRSSKQKQIQACIMCPVPGGQCLNLMVGGSSWLLE